MVFSIDLAVNQLIKDKVHIEENTYLGIKTLTLFDNWYNMIHKFIRSITFDSILGYYIIAPFVIFNKKYSSDISMWLFLWQTSYVIIVLVLLLLVVSDFNIFRFIHMIHTHGDKSKIKSYILYVGRKKLRHDIKRINYDRSFIQFIRNLIKITYNSKRSNYVPTGETFQLIYLMSTIIFNYKYYLHERYINTINSVYVFIKPFMGIILKYFKYVELFYINRCPTNTIKNIRRYKQQIIKRYVQFISKLLCNLHLKDVDINSVDIFPYELVNKKFIHCNNTWCDLNNLFGRNKFIKHCNINLHKFRYKPSGYKNIDYEIIQNNIKKFINNELSYLYYQYRHNGMSNDVYNSLMEVFPKFLKEYITSNKFINHAEKMFSRGKPIVNKIFLDSLNRL